MSASTDNPALASRWVWTRLRDEPLENGSRTDRPSTGVRFRQAVVRTCRGCAAIVTAVAFWIAALLPIAAIPLYAALQYATFDPAIVVGVALVDLLALAIGHGHDPGATPAEESSHSGSG